MEKRVFLIVLDSFGIGAEPDAAAFGDEGTNFIHCCSHRAAVGIKMLISTTSVGKHTYDDFIARRNSVSVICFSILIASISFFLAF